MMGRFFGWFMLGLAFLAASADAVLALGSTGYDSLATGEVLTLLAGQAPQIPEALHTRFPMAVALWLLELPAWIVMGGLGIFLLLLFRPKHRKMLFVSHNRRRLMR